MTLEELVAAVKEANDWLKAMEGVDLLYYMPDSPDKELLKKLIEP